MLNVCPFAEGSLRHLLPGPQPRQRRGLGRSGHERGRPRHLRTSSSARGSDFRHRCRPLLWPSRVCVSLHLARGLLAVRAHL
eukprot:1809714-Alexandrium_andersonii.AAC.1